MFDKECFQWAVQLLFLGIAKVNTDIDMCTLSPQEAAFGLVVHLLHFLSKPYFPLLQWASAVKVRKDWGAAAKREREHQKKKQVGGREMEEKKKEKSLQIFASLPHPPKHTSLHQTLQHSSFPFPFSPSLLANKHALLRTHGVHSKLLSLTSAVRHLAQTLTTALEYTSTLGERCCHSTHSHMFRIIQCLSWLYIAP